jgi:uncharacterized integral membrane protein
MKDDDRKDLPPLAAGSGRSDGDPDATSFEDGTAGTASAEPGGKESAASAGKAAGAAGAAKAAGAAEPKAEADAERRVFVGTGLFWGLIVGVILAVLVVFFAAQNTQDSTVKLFWWNWSSPLFVVILISLILGIVLDEIVGLVYRARRRRRLAEKEELQRLRGDR